MKIVNKKAKFDYEIIESLEAGIVLVGTEVKAIRAKKVDFHGSYIRPIGGEICVVNMHIGVDEGDARRSRKLLLNKNEILNIKLKLKANKLTAVPLSVYTKARKLKLEIGLVSGRKKHQKRAELKKRDIDREIESEFKDL